MGNERNFYFIFPFFFPFFPRDDDSRGNGVRKLKLSSLTGSFAGNFDSHSTRKTRLTAISISPANSHLFPPINRALRILVRLFCLALILVSFETSCFAKAPRFQRRWKKKRERENNKRQTVSRLNWKNGLVDRASGDGT